VRHTGLRRFVVPVKLCSMKRELIALVLMLAIGMQGSVAAFAATSPLVSTDCQSSAVAHSDASQDCCPKGPRAMSCCLDLCLSTVGAAVSSPPPLGWFALSGPVTAAKTSIFSSRGNAPLIRPPIL
jgi:hypothetical protein